VVTVRRGTTLVVWLARGPVPAATLDALAEAAT
jgi:hypothetical protein